ncbi:hypothetical protein J437_LFUL016623 [Ladona fulva]|uniref:SH2 domain-containing protein n=1 Tax=Ladona fulva TaxID=123851 RepID=A0A8K0P527_LADFU|nr:hypothetical protein J437_LFUL016623 [Ladona fulva]
MSFRIMFVWRAILVLSVAAKKYDLPEEIMTHAETFQREIKERSPKSCAYSVNRREGKETISRLHALRTQTGQCSGLSNAGLREHGFKGSSRRDEEDDEENELEDDEDEEEEEEETACDIGLMERLIRSHPVWFLPGIQRAGAVHLLQGKEEGNFVVRQSSQPDTMAISVRLPQGKGPYIEHYLVQAVPASTPSPTTPSCPPPPHGSCGGQQALQSPPPQQLSLESSDNRFDSIPALIAHYSQCCDELPVQLTLPRAIREARNRQQLSSLALLGQEFWRYPMANPRPERGAGGGSGILDTAVADGLTPPSSHHSSLSSFGSGGNHSGSMQGNCVNGNSTAGGVTSKTASSPDSCDVNMGNNNIVLNLSPLSGEGPTLSSFRGTSASSTLSHPPATSSATTPSSSNPSPPRGPRPTPPNTLNIVPAASPSTNNAVATPPGARVTSPSSIGSGKALSPPPPPPRWAKPAFAAAAAAAAALSGQNFTVTTTVTFSVNQLNGALVNYDPDNVNSPPAPAHVEVQLTPPTTAQQQNQHQQQRDPGVVSPVQITPTGEGVRGKGNAAARREKRMAAARAKESRHYRESDILDSPTVYYRSSMADKVSDYEDIWGPSPRETTPPVDRLIGAGKATTPELLTFKPRQGGILSGGDAHGMDDGPMVASTPGRPPDLLERLNAAASMASLNRLGSPLSPPPPTTPDQTDISPPKHGSPFYAEPADAILGRGTTSPAQEAAAIVAATAAVPRRRQRRGVGESGGPARQQLQQRLASHRHSDPTMLNWTAGVGAPRRVVGGGTALERIDSNDELRAVEGAEAERMQLHAHLHRLHSPPRPQQPSAPQPQLSSSVDNLNLLRSSRGPPVRTGKPVQPPRIGGANVGGQRAKVQAQKVQNAGREGRRRNKGGLFHDTSWAVDSSWEFIGNGEEAEDEDEELEGPSDGDMCEAEEITSGAEDNGVTSPTERRFPCLQDGDLQTPDDDGDAEGRRLTVHHLIVKKLPHLYSLLFESEGRAGSAPHGMSSIGTGGAATDGGMVGSRISAYDNVEGRGIETCTNGTMNRGQHHLSAASQVSDEDTQTVFSEPWDSSRWEGLLNGSGRGQEGGGDDAALQAEAEKAVSSFLSDAESLVHLSAGQPLISDAEDETMVSGAASGYEYSSPGGGGCFGRARKPGLRGRLTDSLI